MKSNVEKELKKKNKMFDFMGLFKNFVSTSQLDISEEEEILKDSSLSELEKAELLSGIKNTDNLAHSLFEEKIKKNARKTNMNINVTNVNPRINSKSNITNQKQQGR